MAWCDAPGDGAGSGLSQTGDGLGGVVAVVAVIAHVVVIGGGCVPQKAQVASRGRAVDSLCEIKLEGGIGSWRVSRTNPAFCV